MNCLEFRRTALADPRHVTEAAHEHAGACAECADFLVRARRHDAKLERALHLPVPECLQARILLSQAIGKPSRKRPVAIALAATLLLAVFAWQQFGSRGAPLHETVANYMQQNAMSTTAGQPSPAELERLFADVGITVDAVAGPIAAARPCLIDNAPGAHLVVTTPQGPVTVLILPHSEIRAPVEFTVGARLTGRLMPCPKGSIAIIGEDPALIEAVHRRFEGAVGWI